MIFNQSSARVDFWPVCPLLASVLIVLKFRSVLDELDRTCLASSLAEGVASMTGPTEPVL